MIRTTLRKENLFVKTFKDIYGVLKYLVINADNLIQTSEDGLSIEELIEYAGI